MIARILATFDILPTVGENGEPLVPRAEFIQELIRYAKHRFLSKFGIVSRNRSPPQQSSRPVRVHRETSFRKSVDAHQVLIGEVFMTMTCVSASVTSVYYALSTCCTSMYLCKNIVNLDLPRSAFFISDF